MRMGLSIFAKGARMYKTTPEDFELFKSECQWWLDLWGLSEYLVEFIHGIPDQTVPDSEASCGINETSLILFFTLALEINDSVVAFEESYIVELAYHEVGEALLSKLTNLAHERYVTPKEILQAQHAILNRMQGVMLHMRSAADAG